MSLTYNIPSRLEWMRRDEDAKLKQIHPFSLRKWVPYDSRDEPLPDLPWYKLDQNAVDTEIRAIAESVKQQIKDAREDNKEMESLRASVDNVQKVTRESFTEVALVGLQGVGKSLLINALLDRRKLSKTSAEGRACTASAIRYLYKPGAEDRARAYDAEVQFMDEEHLKEVIQEHAKNYRYYHFDAQDEEATLEDENSAATSDEFFQLIFNTKNSEQRPAKLDELLTTEAIDDGSLVQETVSMALERIKQAGADGNHIKKFEGLDETSLLQRIDGYIAPHATRPSLWPIVHFVNVYMGSSLARNGVAIIDLPGLGDLNQSRTAATNAIRRKADFEIIVAKSERVATDEAVHRQVRRSIKAHGAKNTILVLTKIDECITDHHQMEIQIEKCREHPFPEIRTCCMEAEQALERILEKEQDEDFDEIEANRKENLITEYIQYLKNTATIAFVETRAAKIAEEMRNAFLDADPNPIEVFSVSAGMYMDWLKVRTQSTPLFTPAMTGIPQLRRLLLSITAESNWQLYRKHALKKMPRLLEKIARITDDQSKDDAYAAIRPALEKNISALTDAHHNSFAKFLANKIPRIWADEDIKARRLTAINAVVKKWSEGVRWNTYNMALRQWGIVGKTGAKKYKEQGQQFNWNEDISDQIFEDMGNWKRKLTKVVTRYVPKHHDITLAACRSIVDAISSSALAPSLKEIAIEEWGEYEETISEHSETLRDMLEERVSEVYKYATTEEDFRCMIAQINSDVYDAVASIPRGGGRFATQKRAMSMKFRRTDEEGETILDKINIYVNAKAHNEFSEHFGYYMDGLVENFESFDEHIGDRLPPEYEMTPHDLQVRASLKGIVQDLEDKVQNIQAIFELSIAAEIAAKNAVSEPASKKQKLEECSEDNAPEDDPPQWLKEWELVYTSQGVESI